MKGIDNNFTIHSYIHSTLLMEAGRGIRTNYELSAWFS